METIVLRVFTTAIALALFYWAWKGGKFKWSRRGIVKEGVLAVVLLGGLTMAHLAFYVGMPAVLGS